MLTQEGANRAHKGPFSLPTIYTLQYKLWIKLKRQLPEEKQAAAGGPESPMNRYRKMSVESKD